MVPSSTSNIPNISIEVSLRGGGDINEFFGGGL